jgi:hypothetical protein
MRGTETRPATPDAYGGAARSRERLEAAREVARREAHGREDRGGRDAVQGDGGGLGKEQLRAAHGAAEDRLQGAPRNLAGDCVPGDERDDERQQDERGEGKGDERDHEPVLQ